MVVGEFAESRDLVIVGGGPGGYHAAIRAAQLGLQVTLIEKEKLGGICLNEGCIPSKVFAYAAKQHASIAHFSELGIEIDKASFDYDKLLRYKEKIVTQLRKGIETLCAANKIEIIQGEANFIAENRIGVEAGHQFDIYEFNHAIIATGSIPVYPKFLPADRKNIYLSYEMYSLSEMPNKLIVYGSDYVSLEIAFSYRNLGADVTILLDNGKNDFPFDESINRELKRILKKQKIEVQRGFHIDNVTSHEDGVAVRLSKNENAITMEGTHLYIGAEACANVMSLGLERLGVEMTADSFIQTDQQMRTSLPGIFAIGDATNGIPSAIKAMKQGKIAAEEIAGLNSEADLTFLPTIVHTIPPIASVGLTEKEAVEQGYQVKTSQFSYSGNSMAMITNEKSGLTKVIKDKETDLLLGFHTIGAGAVELISTGTSALEMAGRDEDLSFPLYPHPSFNETLLEAVEGLSEKAVHIPPAKRKKAESQAW
ncbi:dihydrolipoyl dehydrogenase [Oceanobacillus sp. FSL H7-0719]|uniref:dihydrolipoyl dehydrogenase n=1 Tax=Oceanobacillus sp. FSL H7-0719 TaxID=2954507 RepID=UPI003254DC98